MINVLYGKSGAGKTRYIFEDIKKQVKNSRESGSIQRNILIVPEQYTFKAQKDLIGNMKEAGLGAGLLFTEVQSFLRLSYSVFQETGKDSLPVLSEIGKVMLIRKLLSEHKEQLSYFGKNIKKKGYVEEIKSFISELMQYGITCEKLDDVIKSSEKKISLKHRLDDIKVVYEGLDEYVSSNNMITSDAVMRIFGESIKDSKRLKGSIIYLDGFTGFTVSQMEVVKELAKVAKEVNIVFTKKENSTINRITDDNMMKLEKMCIENDIEYKETELKADVEKYKFAHKPGLAKLEEGIFSDAKIEPYKGIPEDLEICVRKNPRSEIKYVIQNIKKLMLDGSNDIRYGDIAIICADMGKYAMIAESEMRKANIPTFIDNRKDISTNMIIDLLASVLNICRNNYSYNSCMRFLKNEIVIDYLKDNYGFTENDVNILDNFLIASGFRGYMSYKRVWKNVGKRLRMPVKKRIEGVEEDGADIDISKKTEDSVNALREAFINLTGDVYSKLKSKASLENKINAINEFLYNKLGVEGLVEKSVAEFEKNGDFELASEYSQILEVIEGVFEEVTLVLGDEVPGIQELVDLIDTGISNSKIGVIPPKADSVTFGDISRTRIGNVKYLFLIGFNESNIPKSGDKGGIITDSERVFLQDAGFELAPNMHEQILDEEFYIYLALTKPSEKLYISYSETSGDGSEDLPAYIVKDIRGIFPDLRACTEYDKPDNYDIAGADYGKSYLLKLIRKKDSLNTIDLYVLKSLLSIYPEYERINTKKIISDTEKRLTKEIAKELYRVGEGANISVSQMETFASCEYSYFMKYGLRLQERVESGINNLDIGNIVHKALELYQNNILDKPVDSITEEQKELFIREALNEAINNFLSGNKREDEPGSDRYIISRVERAFNKTVGEVEKQLSKGNFVIHNVERGYNQSFKEGKFTGVVDRVDIAKTDDKTFVKIVDYKTGNNNIKMNMVLNGLQLQLLAYLKQVIAEVEKEKAISNKVTPTGFYYFNIDDDVKDEEAKKKEKILLEGGTLKTEEAIYNTDREMFDENDKTALLANRSSEVVKISTKTNPKSFDDAFKASDVYSETDFNTLLEFATLKVRELARRRNEGYIDTNPYQEGKSETATSSCKYCKFKKICGFDGDKRIIEGVKDKKDSICLSEMKAFIEEFNKGEGDE
ncbi:MAG: exodeoxyribonuclease V subunit gamma [Lachnospiraceae bacterium]|nr:exodeoxyribonuclease V subunit gamma [Lachnospiraceae bacterium]